MGFLEYIIVTPSHHRLHHAFNEKYLDFIHSRCESMIGSSVDFSGRSLNGSVRKYQDLWLKDE